MKYLLKKIIIYLSFLIFFSAPSQGEELRPLKAEAEAGKLSSIEVSKNLYRQSGTSALESLGEIAENDYLIREDNQDLVIAFKTIAKNDPTLNKGTSKIQTPGTNGLKRVVYRVLWRENEEIERTMIKEEILKQPIDRVILQGSREIKKETLYFLNKNLALKEEPSKRSKTLLTIPKGTHLDYIGASGAWYKCTYKNKTGYLSSQAVSKALGYKAGNVLIVNKAYPLSSNFNPGVNPEALWALNKMKSDAKKSGINLNVFSDFRSYQYQLNLHNRYVKKDGKKKAESYSARAGHSEHQTGLAFDIGGGDSRYYTSQRLGTMKEGLWMAENSYKYGFILRYPRGKENISGYSYEPWHFRYVGVSLAKDIKNSKVTLDEYFNAVGPPY